MITLDQEKQRIHFAIITIFLDTITKTFPPTFEFKNFTLIRQKLSQAHTGFQEDPLPNVNSITQIRRH